MEGVLELLAKRERQLEAVCAEHSPLIVERNKLKGELAVARQMIQDKAVRLLAAEHALGMYRARIAPLLQGRPAAHLTGAPIVNGKVTVSMTVKEWSLIKQLKGT